MPLRYGLIPIAPDGRRTTLAASTGHILPTDYRAAAEFIAGNDPDDPALAVKNGDGRYWLFATRKTPHRSPTHVYPPRRASCLRAGCAHPQCDGGTAPPVSPHCLSRLCTKTAGHLGSDSSALVMKLVPAPTPPGSSLHSGSTPRSLGSSSTSRPEPGSHSLEDSIRSRGTPPRTRNDGVHLGRSRGAPWISPPRPGRVWRRSSKIPPAKT